VVELIDQMHETTMVVEENDKDPWTPFKEAIGVH
jgi:hypothetical protein